MEEKLLTPEELAERWSISLQTLCNWRSLGKPPAFIKIGGSIRYSLEEISKMEKKKDETN
jgi:predicted site-specific integrase-resolvase